MEYSIGQLVRVTIPKADKHTGERLNKNDCLCSYQARIASDDMDGQGKDDARWDVVALLGEDGRADRGSSGSGAEATTLGQKIMRGYHYHYTEEDGVSSSRIRDLEDFEKLNLASGTVGPHDGVRAEDEGEMETALRFFRWALTLMKKPIRDYVAARQMLWTAHCILHGHGTMMSVGERKTEAQENDGEKEEEEGGGRRMAHGG